MSIIFRGQISGEHFFHTRKLILLRLAVNILPLKRRIVFFFSILGGECSNSERSKVWLSMVVLLYNHPAPVRGCKKTVGDGMFFATAWWSFSHRGHKNV